MESEPITGRMSTDLDQRLSLLRAKPFFAHYSEPTLKDFANLFHDVVYPKGQVIVEENEIIDSIFMIVAGEADVTRSDHRPNIIATLYPGETIGLSDSGFYSESGVRSATVAAKTPVHLIRLSIEDLEHFLSIHAEFDMQRVAAVSLRMAFIKQLEPFNAIGSDLLHEIANQIKEVDLPANQIIFKQGDIGACCYLLCSGSVEISITQADGSKHVLDELEAVTLFGEMAVLTEKKRNADARTLTSCKLLVLEREQFLKLVQKDGVTSDMIVSLMMDRDRPTKANAVTVHTRKKNDNVTIIILKNSERGNYMQISEESLFVWNLLDGEHTLQDIALAFYQKYQSIAIDAIANLIMRFIDAGFAEASGAKRYSEFKHVKWQRAALFIRKVMEAEIAFKNVDNFLTEFYQNIGYLFYTRTAHFIMAIIAISGFFAFALFFNQAAHSLHATKWSWLLLLLQSPALLLVVPLHEFAHALTTKAYGRQIHRMGVGWFWFGPIAFTDTSDMWLSDRKSRTMVNVSGIYLNAVLAGFSALLAWIVPNPALAAFLWLFSMSNYLGAWTNSNPLIELDGYFILMDLFDKPNLRSHAIDWLVRERQFKQEYLAEICYWLSCVMFILISAFFVFLIQHYVLNNILPAHLLHIRTSYLQWILPFLVILFSSLGIYAVIKRQQR